ncbi:protein prune homolog 2 isoform X2 [Onthophagus taurus]|uniref:protein prune homolog 2 isoform X2 n=1 Tax=Onthophagus taurus TaxID=166361 RepID=UPI000C20EA90|nr:protein prune homolog 2 isoform X2 [Onthophagus taurus]
MNRKEIQESKDMDVSERADNFVEGVKNPERKVLRLRENTEKLDNTNMANSIKSSRNYTSTQNATYSHPLMNFCTSPVSPDYPDLIPEKAKRSSHQKFRPQAHSSANDLLDGEDENNLEYDNNLAEFPSSPSELKKIMIDMPIEVCPGDISDTENDKSIYEAHLSSNFQNVSLTMNEKEGNLNFLAHGRRSNKLRRIKVVHTDMDQDSDVSSLDSNSDSLKSEDCFQGMIDLDDDCSETGERNESPEPIEPLSAAEERKHARHWQRMVLPGGEQRTIDMRVIEPYKRVLSHGGYLRSGGHTAIVVFSACYLPDKSRIDYDYVMDNLFLYVLWTLERLVTEDYALIYLHGAASKLPSFSWLKRCYQMVGRKLRKNLVHLYIVHPTLWIKTMLFMAKPFISSKFYRKITFSASLRELTARVPLEMTAIPEKVKAYDKLHCSI